MNNKKKKNMLPALAMAGPVSVWMILFVTIPMLYIIYISFMSRGVFGDVVYKFSTESYKTILNPTYFKVILKSLKAAGITTILCLLLGYPLAYIIAHKPKDTAAKLITLIMIPFWTNSLMRLNSCFCSRQVVRSTISLWEQALSRNRLHLFIQMGWC